MALMVIEKIKMDAINHLLKRNTSVVGTGGRSVLIMIILFLLSFTNKISDSQSWSTTIDNH